MGLMVVFLLVAGVVVLGFAVLGKDAKRVDTNLAILQNAEALEKSGSFEALAALEGQGDKTFPDTFRKIQFAAARGKKNFEIVRSDRDKAESDDFFKVQIHSPHESGSTDSAAMVLRCDEFIRRWPNHERAEDANFIRMSLTGEPSPQWTAAKGGNAPGKAFISITTLCEAAETEAGRRLAAGRFVQACGVYDMFLTRAVATVSPESQEKFKADMAKKKKYITDKAKDAFDKVEEKAMVLEDRKQYQEAEDLYREARENIALGENVKRCDEEIGRLQGFHR